MFCYRLKWILLATFIIYLSGINSSIASSRIAIKPSQYNVYYFTGSASEFVIDQVIKLPPNRWQPVKDRPVFGLMTSHYWLKIEIDLRPYQSDSDRLLLKVNNPLIDSLEVHQPGNEQQAYYSAGAGNYSAGAGNSAGNSAAFSQRAIASHHFILPLPTQVDAKTIIYVKSHGPAWSYLPITIVSASHYIQDLNNQVIVMGIIIGLLLLAALFSTLAYLATRERHYSHFSCYLVASLMLIITIDGYSSLYLWPGLTWLQHTLIPSIIALTLYFGLRHSYLSLNLPHPFNFSSRILKWLGLSLLVVSAVSLALPLYISAIIVIASTMIVLTIITLLLVKLTYQRHPNAQYYLSGWLVLSAGTSIVVSKLAGLADIGLAPQTPFTLAIFSQVVIFCVPVTKNYFAGRQQLVNHKNDALRQLQQLNQQTESVLQQNEQQQLDLEALVDERTFELNMTLRELQETNQRLEEQSTIDALTGAKNRRFFDLRYQAEQRLSRRQQSPLSLLLLDADKFKLVNDNYGHQIGDQVLIAICHRAASMLKRPNDYVCRYGGEEFAILLPNTDSAGGLKVAELIRREIADTSINADSYQLEVTVSIGLSTTTVDHQSDPNALFSAADKALYKAKSLGRNRVVVADDINSQLITRITGANP